MGMFDGLIDSRAGIADKKKERVDAASAFKKKLLDPAWGQLEQGNYDVMDGDTVRMRDTGRHVRFAAPGGESIDTFETDAQRYKDQPDRLAAHKKAYARKTGKPEWTVTVDQLVDQGLVQKQRLQQHLDQGTATGAIEYQEQGVDAHGRTLAQFRNVAPNEGVPADNTFFESLTSREESAAYDSKFNRARQAQDIRSGVSALDDQGRGPRSYKDMLLDQPVNFTHGAAQMLNSIGQAAAVITGTNTKGVDRFFSKNKERLENLKKSFLSPQQLRRERKARSESGFNEELYELNEKKYLRNGYSKNGAKVAAGIDEFVNSIRNLFQNPGKIIDATVESLPYMVAVGGVGRVAINSAVKSMEHKILGDFAKAGLTGEKGAAMASNVVAKWTATEAGKKSLATTASRSGMTTVGLTEGITTAADVYDSVRNMTEKQAMQSEKYQALRFDEGLTHDEAVEALAEGAFTRTLASVALMAGTAAKLTGAGAFESKLFTGLADIKKAPVKAAAIPTSRAAIKKSAEKAAAKAKKRTEAGIVSKTTRAVAAPLGRGIKKVSGPGGKEAAEEFIQSGGGEFLSQLQSFEATGKKIGPGVGQAAAEGAVIGFASGAGISTITGSLKAFADGAKTSSNNKAFQKRQKDVPHVPKGQTTPGGSTTALQEKIAIANDSDGADYKSDVAFVNSLNANSNVDGKLTLEKFNEIEHHYENAVREEKELDPADVKIFEDLKDLHEAKIALTVTELQKKKDGTFTAGDIAVISEAGRRGLIKDSDLKKLPKQARDGLVLADKARRMVQQATEHDDPGRTDASRVGGKSEIDRVNHEKFGDVTIRRNDKLYRGMAAYQREMSEAVANNDTKAYFHLGAQLKNFRQIMRNNIGELRQVIAAGQAIERGEKISPHPSKKYKYIAGSSEHLLDVMLEEGKTFAVFHEVMADEYENWHPEGGKRAVKQAAEPLVDKVPHVKTRPAPAQEGTQEGTGERQPVKRQPAATQSDQSKPIKRGEQAETAEHDPFVYDENAPIVVQDGGLNNMYFSVEQAEAYIEKNDNPDKEGTEEEIIVQQLANALAEQSTKDRTPKKITPDTTQADTDNAFSDLKKGNVVTSTSGRSFVLLGSKTESGKSYRVQEVDATNTPIGKPKTFPIKSIQSVKTVTSERTPSKVQPGQTSTGRTTPKVTNREQSTEYSADRLREIIRNGDLLGGLTELEKHSNPLFRNLAKRLGKTLKNSGTTVIVLPRAEFDERFKHGQGIYSPIDNAIYIADDADITKTVLHEAIHAGIKDYFTAITFPLSPEQERLQKEFTDIRDLVLSTLAASKYPTEVLFGEFLRGQHIEEIITYALTEPKFQEILKGIPVEKDVSLFDKFTQALLKLLGLEKEDATAFSELINVSFGVLKETTAFEKDGIFLVRRPTESTTEAPTKAEIEVEQSLGQRLAAVMDLKSRNEKGNLGEGEIRLTNDADFKWLNETRAAGTPVKEALDQLFNIINDQRNKDIKLPEETPIEENVLDAFKAATQALNSKARRAVSFDFTDESIDFGTDYERLRGLNGTSNPNMPSDRVKTLTLQALKDFRLPQSLKEVFQKKGKETDSLFSAIPNVMNILKNRAARLQLVNDLDLNVVETEALQTFIAFYDEFSNQLNEMQRQLTENNMHFADEKLMQDALYYFMKDGNIDQNVVAAMAMESMAWLATGAPRTIYNDSDAINGIFGRDSNALVDDQEKRVLTASGTLRHHAISEIGQAVFKHLNLRNKRNPEMDSLIMDRMIMSLGATAITTLSALDRIELIKVDSKWFTGKMSSDNERKIKGAPAVDFIRAKTHDLSTPERWTGIDKNSLLEVAYREGSDMFERIFGSDTDIRMPSFTEPTEVDTKVSRSLADIPEPLRERIDYNQKQRWQAQTELTDLLNQFDPVDYLKIAHEYVDDEGMKRVHETDKKSVQGRNDGLMRDLAAAMSWGESYKDKAFYFTYKVIRSGRVYIDSNVINPQSSKVHRFLFAMEEWRSAVPVSDTNKYKYGNHHGDFLLAVGLGLGVDVDKLSRKESIDETLGILQSPEGIAALALLKAGPAEDVYRGTELEVLGAILKEEGTHTLAALQAYNKFETARDNGDASFITHLPMETDGVTNGTAAGILQTPAPNIHERGSLKQMYHAVGIFFKNDAIMYKNYQDYIDQGGLDNYQDVALKTSVELEAMTRGERNETVGSQKKYQAAKRRNYMRENAAFVFQSGLLPDIEADGEGKGLTAKEGRQWAKDPLMIAAYGASLNSIINKIIENAEVEFRSRLASVDTSEFTMETAQEIADVLNTGYQIAAIANKASESVGWKRNMVPALKFRWTAESVATAASEIEGVKNGEYENNLHKFALNFVMPKEVSKKFNEGIRVTYGGALRTALEQKLEPMQTTRDSMNMSNKLMNEIFVQDYRRRVLTTETLRRKDDPDYILSKADRKQIFQDMHNEGLVPSVATAMQQKLSDNLEITNYTREPIVHKRGKGQSHLSNAWVSDEEFTMIDRAYRGEDAVLGPGKKGQTSASARVTNEVPNSDVGVSGVVKMIHALDGVNNSYAWGNYPVLNVHDAQIGALHMSDQIAGETNLDFVNMHEGYSLVEEIHKSLTRMTVLLKDNDGRLSNAQKDNVYEAFIGELKTRDAIPLELLEMSPREVTESIVLGLREISVQNKVARKFLFDNMRMIHQFAKDGTERDVFTKLAGPDTAELDPNILLVDHNLGMDQLATMYVDDIDNTDIKARDAKVETLLERLTNNGDVNEALSDYVREDSPSAKDLMEVIQAAYKRANHPAGELLAYINNILAPHLERTGTTISPDIADVKFEPVSGGTGIIKFVAQGAVDSNDNTFVEKVIRQIITAASQENLAKLENDNNDEFQRLYDKAINWATELSKSTNTSLDEVAISNEILVYRNSNPPLAISTYLAYSLATGTPNADQYTQWFGTDGRIGSLMADLFSALQDTETGVNTLYSSNDRTNDQLFKDKKGELLEGDKMEQVIEDLIKLDVTPDDLTWQNALKDLARTLVIPGIKSAEAIYQYVAVNSAGSKNIGEINGDKLRLEAAGNKLTSTVDMSLLETAMHEYVHGFSRDAIERDHAIRTELTRLFDLAADPENGIRVTDFLEEGDDTQIGLERAQERYDYIFSNGKRGLHEFLAIGLTNKPLALALTRLENKAAVEPIFGSGILQSMMNVFNRIVQYVSKHSVQSHGGTVHEAMFKLGQNIIANNQRNMQRVRQTEANEKPLSRVDRMNRAVVKALSDKIVDPLINALDNRAKDNVPTKKNAFGYAKSLTYSVIRSRDKEVRSAYNELYRSMRGGKDNEFFKITGEFLPYNPDNLGTADSAGNTKSLGWIDLLRKSKVAVDMARQNMIEHTASFMKSSFDKKNHLSKADKKAVTAVLLKNDFSVLMEGETGLDMAGLQQLLNDPRLAVTQIQELRNELGAILNKQNAGRFINVFDNQMNSLANIMQHGVATVANPMLNAHNIVKRYNLGNDQAPLENEAELINLVDRITTLKAFDMSSLKAIEKVRDIANHEMSRTNVSSNGFDTLIGMMNNFKMVSQQQLFKDNPTQMMKGYVYEILDGDVNIEYVDDTKANNAMMLKRGMTRVGPVPKDDLDPNRTQKILWKGLKGLATYNKSTVSLTDEQGRGANLFTAGNRDSSTARRNLGRVRADAFKLAQGQFSANNTKPGQNLVPILDDQGNITDYRYLMSEQNKQKIMKKEDPFDKVLPRMFATIPDRVNTKQINQQVVDLLWDEYEALGNSREHKFLEISKNSGNQESRDMYNLLPSEMQRQLKAKFGSDTFYIRDDVVNLVMGFRKMSVANTTLFGEYTPIVRQAEKIWHEVVSHIRITIAIRTPAVVIGNIASNTAMLLSEGIPVGYIRDKGAEAISAMRRYQKDVRARDELQRKLGSDTALNRASRSDAVKLGRLNAAIKANPVGKLVDEGLFTSIAEDLGANDTTMGTSAVNRAIDATRAIGIPSIATSAIKELYMLPGSTSYRAAIAATQYGDFVGRYIKFKYDTERRGMPEIQAIHEALAAFIYYDMPQSRTLQMLNDNGLIMFTKFFLRIQPIIAKMYTQNPVSAFGVLAFQSQLLANPLNENIAEKFGFDAMGTKMGNFGPNLDRLDPTEPSLLQWILGPFGL